MTIVEFIEARLAEDERMANESGGLSYPLWFARRDPEQPYDRVPVYEHGSGDPAVALVMPFRQSAEHIARHDPARVLRQCAALRRVVDAEIANISNLDGEFGDGCRESEIRAGECKYPDSHPDKSVLLRALASTWVDHPDYQAEWGESAS